MRPPHIPERDLLLEISQLPGVEVGLFEVTAIQMEKSIIDKANKNKTQFQPEFKLELFFE